MSRRHFVETPIREEGSPVPVPRYRLTCGSCGVGETLGRQNFGPGIADEQVPKKFEAKGWVVGKRVDGKDDRCPGCVNREQEQRRRRLQVVPAGEAALPDPQPVPTEVEAARPSAEPPRQMSRDERRVIWAKLEDVYLDERRGYTAGWDDERVAVDLGVPRAWISQIREENFGPDISVDLEKLLTEASDSLQEYDELQKLVERSLDNCVAAEKQSRRAKAEVFMLKPRVELLAKRIDNINDRLKRCNRSQGAA